MQYSQYPALCAALTDTIVEFNGIPILFLKLSILFSAITNVPEFISI
nr:MAG TPA: hypothetical protein [Caudoviricetes sp.]DAX51476.1 MAG TPA: hypothetical protein [Caudoviricetes sp.]